MRKRLSLVLLCSVLAAACSFGVIHTIAQITGNRAIGVLSVNESGSAEQDRAYVGKYTTGTTWNHELSIHAIDTNTGVQVGQLGPFGGWWAGNGLRAVSTDPNDDSVWLLTEPGYVFQYNKDLTTNIGSMGTTVQPPPGKFVERMCDLEVLTQDRFVATMVVSDGTAMCSVEVLMYPNTFFPGGWARIYGVCETIDPSPFGPMADCPKVALDPFDEDRIILMKPRVINGPDQQAEVEFIKYELSWANNQQLWSPSYTGGYWLDLPPGGVKWAYVDVAGAVYPPHGSAGILALQNTITGAGILEIRSTTGTLLDSQSMPRLEAIDLGGWLANPAGDLLWWLGQDSSGFELGTIDMNP